MLRQNAVVTQIVAVQAAITADSTDDTILQESDFDSVTFELNVSQIAATTTALDVYIQTPDSAGNYKDVVHFKQFVASSASKEFATVDLNRGAYVGTVGSKTIAASALGVPLLSRQIRVIGDLTGTDAVSFTVTAYFNQQSGRT